MAAITQDDLIAASSRYANLLADIARVESLITPPDPPGPEPAPDPLPPAELASLNSRLAQLSRQEFSLRLRLYLNLSDTRLEDFRQTLDFPGEDITVPHPNFMEQALYDGRLSPDKRAAIETGLAALTLAVTE